MEAEAYDFEGNARKLAHILKVAMLELACSLEGGALESAGDAVDLASLWARSLEKKDQAKVHIERSGILFPKALMICRVRRDLCTQIGGKVWELVVWDNYKHISVMIARMAWRLTPAAV